MRKPYYDAMHNWLQTKYAKRLMKRRGSTAEPVFGTLTQFMGMRKVNPKGLKQANKIMLMAGTVNNLKKFMKKPWNNHKVVSLSMAIPQIDLGQGLSTFLGLVTPIVLQNVL